MIDGLFFGALKSTFAILEALAEYIFDTCAGAMTTTTTSDYQTRHDNCFTHYAAAAVAVAGAEPWLVAVPGCATTVSLGTKRYLVSSCLI